MKAILIRDQSAAEEAELAPVETAEPVPGRGEVLLKIGACGICHTDLHIIEGDLPLVKRPVIPGHQIVGTVVEARTEWKKGGVPDGGENEPSEYPAGQTSLSPGDRVGVPWVNTTCGRCDHCRAGKENLCDDIRFTGYHIDGGFAEYVSLPARSVHRLPSNFTDADAAPLLCAGIIGYRALRLSGTGAGIRLGMIGFGASAHITIQVARHLGCEVCVFSRNAAHRTHAEELGAVWTGPIDGTPRHPLDAIISFAPAGQIVPRALSLLSKGGRLVMAGVYVSPIPEIDYRLIYQERSIISVANSTRADAAEFLELAGKIPVRTEVTLFGLEEGKKALLALKNSGYRGAGVFRIGN